MADGRQQRGANPVGLRELLGLGCLLGELLSSQARRRGRRGREQVAVLGEELRAVGDQAQARPARDSQARASPGGGPTEPARAPCRWRYQERTVVIPNSPRTCSSTAATEAPPISAG